MVIYVILARVSVIDFRGYTTYDTFVRPTGLVESYRTATTGLKASDFEDGKNTTMSVLLITNWEMV